MLIFFVTLRFLNHCVANPQEQWGPQEGYNAVNMFPVTMWVLESLILYCGEATHVDWVSKLCMQLSTRAWIQRWIAVIANQIKASACPSIPLCVRRRLTVVSKMLTVSVFLTIWDEQHACAN